MLIIYNPVIIEKLWLKALLRNDYIMLYVVPEFDLIQNYKYFMN